MIRTKFLYLTVLVISVIFFILYTEPLSLYLLIFISALPFIMGISVILAKKFVKINIEADSDTAMKNDKINISFNIKNKTPVPFTNCVVKLEYYNNLLEVTDYISVTIPVHSLCSEKINFSLVSDHCGIIRIKTESVRLYDFIKLFSCRIKSDKVCEITVLPEIYPVNAGKSFNMMNSDESDVFSKYKSGDDPSEIFDLKYYVPGDKPNRIHWNLSLKHDSLIVRHYSQPINTSVLLILDFCGKPEYSADALDTAAETAFSILLFFTENNIPVNFAYYSPEEKKEVITGISDEKDAALTLKQVFYAGPLKKTIFEKRIKELALSFSDIFFITASEKNMSAMLAENHYDNVKPVFIQNQYSSEYKFEKEPGAVVIPAGKTNQFISDILI